MTDPSDTFSKLLHRVGVAGPALLCAVAGLLAFSGTPAQAGEVHVYNSSFGAPGSGAGQFEDPSDIAVNDATTGPNAGDVYVVDRGNNRIDEFKENGEFIRAWGWGVGTGLGGFEECTEVLGCKAGVAGAGAGQLDAPDQIAVDDSGRSLAEDPSAGDVYVTNTGDSAIEKFGPDGEYVGELTGTCENLNENPIEPGACPGSPSKKVSPFSGLEGVAVDPSGLVWVDQGSGEIDTYSNARTNEFVSRSEPIEFPQHNFAGFGESLQPVFAVDSNDDLYVGYGQAAPFRYEVARLNSAQELAPGAGEENPEGQPAADKGIEVGVHQPGKNSSGNGAKTGVAVDLSSDDVYLDMNGEENTAYSHNDPVWDVEQLASNGALIETFGAAQLADHGGSGLAEDSATGTVYVADDVAGRVWVYTTIPTPDVTTGAASGLQTEGAATLNGEVNPDGKLEECKFEYFSEQAFAENLKNEVQTVTLSPGVSSGEFILSFKGETTEEMPFNATAVGVQNRLERLPAIGENHVAVTGKQGGPYTIEFVGQLAHTKLPALVAESESGNPLQPAGATVTAAIVTPGGDGYEATQTASCIEPDAAEIGTSDSEVAVHANLGGLTPDSLYKYRLQARNENGETTEEYRTFVAPARPAISGVSLSDVGSSAATLSAEVDPGGALTSYRVEYGPSEAYGYSTPVLSAGAGLTSAPVQIVLRGLAGETVYYARVVASNEVAVAQGAPLTFTTPATAPAAPSALPDDRADELVSNFPPGQDEEAYVPPSGDSAFGLYERGIVSLYPFQVAAGGEAVVYAGDPPPANGVSKSGDGSGNEYLATRSSQGAWTQADLQPYDHSENAYLAFSSDLSVGILGAPQSELGGGSGAFEDVYGHATAGGAGGEYEPLYTGIPPNRSTLGIAAFKHNDTGAGLTYVGANSGTSAVPAARDLLLEADDALLVGAGPLEAELDADARQEVIGGQIGNYLYDSAGGRLSLVDVLRDGQVQPNASFGSYPVTGGNAIVPPGTSNAISADGSRIFWTALEGAGEGERTPKALYVRENPTSSAAATVQVDASQGGPESGGGMFRGASADGSKVLFTDCRRLTGESTAVPGTGCSHLTHSAGEGETAFTGNDLYEYELSPETSQPGVLRDLTVSTPGELTEDVAGGDLLGADVQGVLGSSVDGEYVYFAADGVLAGANAGGRSPVVGEPNLYLRHDGQTTFIAALSLADGSEVKPIADCGQAAGCRGDWQTAPSYRTTEVTPDGHSLVFMSNRPLTGYDNVQGVTHLDEVFLYEAQSSALHCVSCNPTGEPPVATEFSTDKGSLEHGISAVGAFFPTGEYSHEPPRVLSADGGRVFFDSAEPLVPAATNGWLDVYEWERDGEGTCTEGQGCVYLLSGGTDPEDSYLIGADTTGDNVFFVSRADLVAQDRGGDDDLVYDARVDGIQPPAASACEGTGCQGVPPTPPIFATPASATITGGDDLPPVSPPPTVVKPKTKTVKCKKGETKNKKNKCVPKKNKKTKAKKAKRASNNRETKS